VDAARRGRSATAAELAMLARDPLLLGMVAIGALACGWFALGRGGPQWQVGLLWPFEVLFDLAMCGISLRIAVRPGLARLQRRWWAILAAGSGMFVIGDGTQAVLTAITPTASKADGGILQGICLIAGLTTTVVGMLSYPNPHRTAAQRLRFWLDAGSVLIAGGALAWCFGTTNLDAGAGQRVATAAAGATVLVVVFATVRMAMSGVAPITRLAAAPIVLAASLQSLPAIIAPVGPDDTISPGGLAARLVPSVLVALGPRIQQVQDRFDFGSCVGGRLRQYRLLPYGSVLVTFTTMLVILPRDLGARAWGVVVGAVLLTCVVVVRQLLVFQDNQRLIERLDEQATRDGLTGLYNRTAFVGEVSEALADPMARPRLHLLLIDLDDFKAVNDTLGHAAGDELLVATAKLLLAAVGPGDVVARLGGDEFAVLVRTQGGAELAAQILTDAAQPLRMHGHTVMVEASIGVATVADGDQLADIMRNADVAMYAAKETGKGVFRVYTPSMGARILRDARLTTELRDGIGTDQFGLHYQPIVRMADKKVVGVEALLRWRHPAEGNVPPDRFIPVAERSGLIVPIGRWVLRAACEQLAGWRSRYPEAAGLVLNVNVAGRQLQEAGFAGEVAAVLADTGVPTGLLTIEVTETAALQDGRTQTTLAELRRLGVGLALDDFGTAASSLGLLLTCPVSALKLDRSFVREVTTAARQSAVATAVIQISRALELSAVAEGVETPEQAAALIAMGYTLAQGFLYARPMPADELVRIWSTPIAAARTG
jgi:diguanylate cyclase (GGDEF)-like protein